MIKRVLADLLCTGCLMIPWSAAVMGQSNSAQERLGNVTRVDCRFSAVATGTWDGSVSSAAVAETDFVAAFSNIDIQQGTADAEGRFGSSYIVVRYSSGYLHFMHMIDIGPLYVTTVFAEETTKGRLLAIHTRHEFAASRYVEFRERPEMYVGDCELESMRPND